jgi:hypothetical protein
VSFLAILYLDVTQIYKVLNNTMPFLRIGDDNMALFDFLKRKGKDEDLGDLGMPGAGGEFPPIDTGFPGPDMGGMPGMQGMQGMPQQRGYPPQMQGQGMGMPQRAPQGYPGQEFSIPPAIQPINIPLGPQQQYGAPQYGPQQYNPPQNDMRAVSDMVRNQIDVISSKFDSMKATLDRINERLDYIEKYLIGRR